MAGNRVKPGSFASQIQQMLVNYSDEAKEVLTQDVQKATEDALREVKSISPKDKGNYRKGWKAQFTSSRTGAFKIVIYNKPYPHLTHLLEHGHLIVKGEGAGGRTRAQPHVSIVQAELDQKVEQILRNKLGG